MRLPGSSGSSAITITDRHAAEKSTELFNGKDLDGWKMTGPGKFNVENGAMVTEGGMGLLFYEREKFGNTTAATIPIAYDECRKSGRVKPGDLVCFVGLGAGFHWGAALMRE